MALQGGIVRRSTGGSTRRADARVNVDNPSSMDSRVEEPRFVDLMRSGRRERVGSGEVATRVDDGAPQPLAEPAYPSLYPPRISRFTVLRILGAGGMGVVYSAYDDELERKVAIKVLQASRSHETRGRSRMLREAQALARLAHPNVVRIYEVGEFDHQLYMAMEFLQGDTLHGWQTAKQRGWREVLAVYLQAGRGLAAAHAAGIVHRDFKPDSGQASQVVENTSVSRQRC
jgi:hypothetical protein